MNRYIASDRVAAPSHYKPQGNMMLKRYRLSVFSFFSLLRGSSSNNCSLTPVVWTPVVFTIAAVTLIAYPSWAEETRPMTMEEVKTLKFHVSVEGVAFDVPVNYHHSEYAMFKAWPRPPEAQVEGRERPKVDVIKIIALLPDMEPYTGNNAAEFDKPGWGKQVKAYMTKRRVNWKYYFENVGPRLKRSSSSVDAPGMLYYRDPIAKHDVYLSHDHPDPNLTRIICKDPEKDKFPYCTVYTRYLDRFDFQIAFGRSYLSQWQDIERKLKALFDRFRKSAGMTD